MQLQEGKKYRDRSGNIHGPLRFRDDEAYPYMDSEGFAWKADGTYDDNEDEYYLDLVEEVTERDETSDSIKLVEHNKEEFEDLLFMANKFMINEINERVFKLFMVGFNASISKQK